MTIKEVARQAGITVQAVYKRIRASGFQLADLKDSETGQLTADGEALIMRLFAVPEAAPAEVETEVKKMRSRVTELTAEVETLRSRIAAENERIAALTEERDYLRTALDNAQKLQALTLAKVPAALPSGEKKRRGLFGLFARGERGNNGK